MARMLLPPRTGMVQLGLVLARRRIGPRPPARGEMTHLLEGADRATQRR